MKTLSTMIFYYFFTDEGQCAKQPLDNDKSNKVKRKTFCFSQPELPPVGIHSLTSMKLDDRTGLSFSQPTYVEDLLVSSQLQATGTQMSQVLYENFS